MFNWVSQGDNIYSLINVLKSPNLLISEGLEFEEYTAFMYKDKALGFKYHSKVETDKLNALSGQQRADYIKERGEEVTSRMNYLKDKFFSKVKSYDKNLFVMCFNSEIPNIKAGEILENLSSIIYDISGNKNSKLMVVFEKKYFNDKTVSNAVNKIINQHNNLIIEKVNNFSNECTQDFNYKEWLRIYKNFEFSFNTNPDYKTNYKNYFKKYRLSYYRKKAFKRFFFSQRKIYKYVENKPVLFREYTVLGKTFKIKIKDE